MNRTSPSLTVFAVIIFSGVLLPRIGSRSALAELVPANKSAAANIVPVIAPPTAFGQIQTSAVPQIAVTKYSFRRDLKDWRGVNAVDKPSVVLDSFARTKPRSTGTFLERFEPQTALHTCLLGRIPPFQVHKSKLPVWAACAFSEATDNLVVTRGYKLIAESTPMRHTLAKELRVLPYGRGSYLFGSSMSKQMAKIALEGMPADDPRQKWLIDMRDRLAFIVDPDAAHAFARAIFQSFNNPDWGNGQSFHSYAPDWEDATGSLYANGMHRDLQWATYTGHFCEGIRLAALEHNGERQKRGLPPLPIPIPILYDRATLAGHNFFDSQQNQNASGLTAHSGGNYAYKDPEPGQPVFMNRAILNTGGDFGHGKSLHEPLGVTNQMAKYIRDHGGAIGECEYMRYTWGDESLWEKNPDGTFKTVTIKGVKNLVNVSGKKSQPIYGQSVVTLSQESSKYISMLYTRLTQNYVEYFFRAGAHHHPLSTQRQKGWEKTLLEKWYRLDTEFKIDNAEGEDGGMMNSRPLNSDWLEMDVMFAYMFNDVLRPWNCNEPILVQGAEKQSSMCYKSKGTSETFTHALYRASRFDWMFDVPFRACTPRHWMHYNRKDASWNNPREAFEKKPVVHYWIIPNYRGRTFLRVMWCYPAQDVNMRNDHVVWVDCKGKRSPGYRFTFVGRSTGDEMIELPAGFSATEPEHIYNQFVDMTGEKQTMRGTYLIPVIYENHPSPPPLIN